jgi:ABC-2 type transport system ATP-binding protein
MGEDFKYLSCHSCKTPDDQGDRNATVIETYGLTKKFGALTAVNNLNLKVKKGEIFGLIGPNGAGKTVTIKMLLGILKPTKGRAIILGEEVPNREVLKRIGYMPQETALYEDLTAQENIRLFGEIYGLNRSQLGEREDEILKFVELTKWKNVIVSNFSGGMKSRLSFACSLLHQPELLFLDEPTVGIDPPLRASFWSHFKELAKGGVTVFITTHYMDEASRCDRVGLIRDGRLLAVDTPNALKSKTGMESLEDVFLALLEEKL